jgi:hypothetical protein
MVSVIRQSSPRVPAPHPAQTGAGFRRLAERGPGADGRPGAESGAVARQIASPGSAGPGPGGVVPRPEIARELSVSRNTVKTHMRNLYTKLGTHCRAEAVACAR